VTRRAYGSGTLREIRPGVWESRLYVGVDPATGKTKQSSRTFHGTKREANDWHDRRRVELATAGRRVATGRHTATVAHLLNEWIDHNRTRWSERHREEVERRVVNDIIPALGSKPLAKLDAYDLDQFYGALGRKGLASGTIRHHHNTIHAALHQAVLWGWLGTNVADRADPPAVKRKKITVPTETQVDRLVATVTAWEDREFLTFLALAAATGARRSELCGLRLDDLDFSSEPPAVTVTRVITEVKGKGAVPKEPKTERSNRRIHLDPLTVAGLRVHLDLLMDRAELAGYLIDANPWLFPDRRSIDCSRPSRPHRFSMAFARACKAAGVTGVRLHDLRHRQASLLLEMGLDVVSVSARLGHAKAATTLNIYGHPSTEGDIRAAALWGQRSAKSVDT
jgi:integrase